MSTEMSASVTLQSAALTTSVVGSTWLGITPAAAQLPIGAIAGGVAGGLVVLIFVAWMTYWAIGYRNRGRTMPANSTASSLPPATRASQHGSSTATGQLSTLPGSTYSRAPTLSGQVSSILTTHEFASARDIRDDYKEEFMGQTALNAMNRQVGSHHYSGVSHLAAAETAGEYDKTQWVHDAAELHAPSQ
jgi:hypothetical protein